MTVDKFAVNENKAIVFMSLTSQPHFYYTQPLTHTTPCARTEWIWMMKDGEGKVLNKL